MKLYTIRMQKFRKAINMIDITVKLGDKTFAPTWDMVRGHKSKTLSDEDYTEMYYQLMRESYKKNKSRWLEVMNMEVVTFPCFCSDDGFCHRFLLVDIFRKLCEHHNVPFEYLGEIK